MCPACLIFIFCLCLPNYKELHVKVTEVLEINFKPFLFVPVQSQSFPLEKRNSMGDICSMIIACELVYYTEFKDLSVQSNLWIKNEWVDFLVKRKNLRFLSLLLLMPAINFYIQMFNFMQLFEFPLYFVISLRYQLHCFLIGTKTSDIFFSWRESEALELQ